MVELYTPYMVRKPIRNNCHSNSATCGTYVCYIQLVTATCENICCIISVVRLHPRISTYIQPVASNSAITTINSSSNKRMVGSKLKPNFS